MIFRTRHHRAVSLEYLCVNVDESSCFQRDVRITIGFRGDFRDLFVTFEHVYYLSLLTGEETIFADWMDLIIPLVILSTNGGFGD